MDKINYSLYKRFNQIVSEKDKRKCREIAHAAGVCVGVVQGMNMGRIPRAIKLASVCGAIGVSADYLLGLKEENSTVTKMGDYERQKLFARRLEGLTGGTTKEIGKAEKDCGVYAGAIRGYIDRTLEPNIPNVLKIAQHYNVPLDWLLGLSEEGGHA